MIQLEPIVAPPRDFKDRRTGLVVFGILSIVAGGFCGLLALVTPVMVLAASAMPQQQPSMSVRDAIIGCLTYALLSAIFVSAGIGSVRIRRWARPVMLIVGWTWLLAGIVGGAMWALMAPDLFDAMSTAAQGQALPPGFHTMVIVVGAAFFLIFMIALPSILIGFYQSRHVLRTLEVFDPVPRWTDRCPITVLGLSLGLAYAAIMLLFMLGYPALPVFGFVVTGAGAMALYAALALVMAWLAWETYRLRPIGWWGSLILFIVMPASVVVSFLSIDPIEIYRQMGFPREQVEMMKQYRAITGPTMALFTGVLGAACVGFILYLKKHFRRNAV